jgi:hypothetical protein
MSDHAKLLLQRQLRGALPVARFPYVVRSPVLWASATIPPKELLRPHAVNRMTTAEYASQEFGQALQLL